MPDVTMTGAQVRTYLLGDLARTADWHEQEARYAGITKQIQHEEAALSLRFLHDQVEGLPADHPKLEEMAAICIRTECRCQRKDDEFFNRLDYTATGYETAEKMLEAMLINYRRPTRSTDSSRLGPRLR